MTIREAIQAMARPPEQLGGDKPRARVAKVTSVSGALCVVETLDTETEIQDVRLQAEDSSGALYTPRVGSFVVIAPMADFEYVVVMYSELDAIKWMDGSYGGLIRIVDLVGKMNIIENKLNDILNAFNSHVHTGVTTGGGSSGTTPTPVTGTITPTQREDIENDKITHGTV